jgi:hypothetical protein
MSINMRLKDLKFKIISLLGVLITIFSLHTIGETMQHTTIIKSSEQAVLNKKNLDKIKRFILKNAQTCTYSNMYNNNPCFTTKHYQYYLNPDPGGPNNHVQWNINCDPKKGDFNTLVMMTLDGNNTYTAIEFIKESEIQLDRGYLRPDFAGLRTAAEAGVKEILLAIKNASKIKNKNHIKKPA